MYFSDTSQLRKHHPAWQLLARKEIRHWIKRGLLLERQGRIVATDALESALRFVQGLDLHIMSSSTSHL